MHDKKYVPNMFLALARDSPNLVLSKFRKKMNYRGVKDCYLVSQTDLSRDRIWMIR